MKKWISWIIIAPLWAVTFSSCRQQEAAEESVLPPALYLTWQRDPTTTMTVHWHSDAADDPSVIRYRRDGDEGWQEQEGRRDPFPHTDRFVHTVELTHLIPDQRYAFRRSDADTIYFFHTMPERLDRPVRFVQGGDVYGRSKWMDAMNRRVAELNPDFMVIGGDLAYADGLPEHAGRWHRYFESFYLHAMTPDNRLIPHVVAIGNHEMQGHFLHWRDDYEPGPAWRERVAPFFFALYAFPGHPGYGVLDFGDYLSVVILDTWHVNPIEGPQRDWLASILAERTHVPHLFPVYHVPAYPGHREVGHINEQIQRHWIPLFEQAGVRLAFEHHDHVFKVTHPILEGAVHPDGIVYVGDGAWGVAVRTVHDPEETWYLRKAASEHHVFEVTLEPHRRWVRAITADGRILDEFEQPVSGHRSK